MRRFYIFASLFFLLIAMTSILDLQHDSIDNLSRFHVYIEIFTLIVSIFGFGFFINQATHLFNSNQVLKKELKHETERAESFQQRAQKYAKGLSQAIDEEFNRWSLTKSEKEVGLLILKGLSNKEISDIQGTSDKTVRHHCTSIYKKSGMNTRSELSAYFLEDLLSPQSF